MTAIITKFAIACEIRDAQAAPRTPRGGINRKFRATFTSAPVRAVTWTQSVHRSATMYMLLIEPKKAKEVYHTTMDRDAAEPSYFAP